MQKYTLNQILRTLDKLFKKDILKTKQFKNIKWENLDEIDKKLTPIEKSLIMDFKNAVLRKQIIEFLAGKETEKESEEK